MSNHAPVCDHLLPARLNAMNRGVSLAIEKGVGRLVVCELLNTIAVRGEGKKSALKSAALAMQKAS